MIRIIRDSIIKNIKSGGPWILLYGRRKTGKTFLARNFIDYGKYFFVSRTGEIFDEADVISYEIFLERIFNSLKSGETVVVDEFHRLPESFLDRLHAFGRRGKLILVTSTLWLARKFLEKNSPLLGLVTPIEVPLIREDEILLGMSKYIKEKRRLIEYSLFLREPWLIDIFETSEDFLRGLLLNIRNVKALIGEIFSEEDRELTERYEGILKAIADGKNKIMEITDYLYFLKLIDSRSPNLVYPYIKILENVGIIERMKRFGKNLYFYQHISPVFDLYFYLDAKYLISERNVRNEFLMKVLRERIPVYVEKFFGRLLSLIFGMTQEKITEKDLEIDIALVRFQKLKVIAEVKWKKEISKTELRKVEDKLSKFKDCKKILIIPEREILPYEPQKIEVWDVERILKVISSKYPY